MQPMPWMAAHIDDLTAYLAVSKDEDPESWAKRY